MDTSCAVPLLGPMTPATTGAPSHMAMASWRSAAVDPGTAAHGRRSPEASPSPVPLSRVVESEQSPTLSVQLKLGRSICSASRPVMLSKR